ncbi:MAG: hypothetical protein ABR550_12470, partial [Wenzhouxiangellaceae bacterium]
MSDSANETGNSLREMGEQVSEGARAAWQRAAEATMNAREEAQELADSGLDRSSEAWAKLRDEAEQARQRA